MRKPLSTTLILALLSFVSCLTFKTEAYSQTIAAQQVSDQERVAQNKQTILSRLKRDKVEYRGDAPGQRVKWEWVDKVVSDYTYQKKLLAVEVSIGEKYEFRSTWVFKDMKVTFQDIFNLGPEDDDKLFPLSYSSDLIDLVPAYSWEGLTFLGKGGEVKGPFKRRIAIVGLVGSFGSVFFPLYLNNEGKERLTLGVASDAYTLKWKDIKNRVVDDMSEADVLERLKLLRDKITPAETLQYR